MVNLYQNWINQWHKTNQTYKVAPCENQKKKDWGGEKKQTNKIIAMNYKGEYDSENQSCNFIVFFFSPFPWPLENTQIKSINGPWRRITLNCSIKPRNAENRREEKKINKTINMS